MTAEVATAISIEDDMFTAVEKAEQLAHSNPASDDDESEDDIAKYGYGDDAKDDSADFKSSLREGDHTGGEHRRHSMRRGSLGSKGSIGSGGSGNGKRRTSITQTTTPALKNLNDKSNKTKAELVKEQGMEYARLKHQKHFADSSIQDNIEDFATFDKSQLVIGQVLGKGRFGTVYEVEGINLTAACTGEDEEQWEVDERKFLSQNVRRDCGEARYAIKMLSPEVVGDAGLFIQGIYDMSIETRILSDTEHTNIVKARAIAKVSPFDGHEFYIMMDRLYDTLAHRILEWNKQQKKLDVHGFKKFRRNSGNNLKKLIGSGKQEGGANKEPPKSDKQKLLDMHIKKMTSAYDLSDALGYLHHRGIIYRDLKPENIGFDIRDDIKLFDFGLATEMKESNMSDNKDDRTFLLTGMTGSPRYMSTEVANEDPYNEKTDVYSFAILFWEMLSTKVPFDTFTMTSLCETVWNAPHLRPPIDDKNCGCWLKYADSGSIQKLLPQMWDADFRNRPSFDDVTEKLRQEIIHLRGGDDAGLEHEKRRSTFVFDKNMDKQQLMKMLSVTSLELNDN